MTPAGFRRIALSFFAASEGSHMGHADFRVGVFGNSRGLAQSGSGTSPATKERGGTSKRAPATPVKSKARIFASLPPSTKAEPKVAIGMVKLTPEQQQVFVRDHPGAFFPAQGAWGKQGCTYVRLSKVDSGTLRSALRAAWLNAAPKDMRQALEAGGKA